MLFLLFAVALSVTTEFTAWKEQYGIEYSSLAEEAKRFTVWSANKVRVDAHNEAADNGEHTFRLGMNHLGHYTNKEYQQMFLGRKPTERNSNAQWTFDTTEGSLGDPTDYNWVDHGVVNAVKDQASCGSCWSFSANAAMEGRYALDSGKLESFSEQELVDCTNDGAQTCDMGGEMHDGMTEIAFNHGGKINTESQYPYTAQSYGKCKANDAIAINAQITGYANVTAGDEDAMKQAVLQYPVLSIAIDASKFSFQMYSSGVYDESRCKNKNWQLDHGVAATGYGVENGNEYWWVRNSWSEGWGMNGYIKMSRNKNNQCGVATDTTFALSPYVNRGEKRHHKN